MNKAAVWVAVVAPVALLGVAAFVYSGVYYVGADKPHWPVTEWLLETVRVRSVKAHARESVVPSLNDPRLVAKGAADYAQMCVGCHLAPGVKDSLLRQGLYPQPPDLSRHEMDPRVTFWVIKHGIKATGMPAWGASHDDAALWNLVAFVAKLPALDAGGYRDLAGTSRAAHDMKPMGDSRAGQQGAAAPAPASAPGHAAEHGAGAKE